MVGGAGWLLASGAVSTGGPLPALPAWVPLVGASPSGAGGAAPGDEAASEAIDRTQPTVAVVTYDPSDPAGLALDLTVLSVDRTTGRGTVLLVPTSVLADAPGYGSFSLREAYAFGGGRLLAVTLDQLLGVRIDAVATLSTDGWMSLVDRLGGLEVDVRTEVVLAAGRGGDDGDDGDDGVGGGGGYRVPAGVQHLAGPQVVDYLTLPGRGGSGDLDRLPRAHHVLDALLARVGDDPDALEVILGDDLPWRSTTGDLELVRAVLDDLARSRDRGEATAVTLPVTAVGDVRDEVHRADAERIETLVAERFGPVRTAGSDGRDVQLLNGNGVPGIGQRVAELLGGGGYRVVLSGNADSFEHDTTRIVLHEHDDAALAVAEDLRQRLGVGEIELAAAPQSVVDVTVVIGADLAGPHG